MISALLFAAETSLTDWSGWGGAGLLGLVLGWLLLQHLPAKDKQINEMTTQNNERYDTQRKEFTDALNSIAVLFKAEAASERQACEKHFSTLAETMNRAFETLGKQLSEHSLRNQQWLETLRSEINSRRAEIEATMRGGGLHT